MKVIAAKGTRCPMENSPRQYITDNEPVDVPDSAFYRRLVTDGSLIISNGKAPVSESPNKKEGGKK